MPVLDASAVLSLAYLAAAVLFILGLRGMTHPRTATRGNLVSAAGMLLAVGATVLSFELLSPVLVLAAVLVGAAIGTWLAVTVDTTAMPQLVGAFNGFGGGASALVAGAELVDRGTATIAVDVTAAAVLAGLVGTVTFTGSFVAAGKLQGVLEAPVQYPFAQAVKGAVLLGAIVAGVAVVAAPSATAPWHPTFWGVVLAAGVLGVLVVLPIGGADMPVIISLLNACSGLAAATTGFVLDNSVLIIAGTLVGASGLILTRVMCRSMNRSLWDVVAGGVGGPTPDGDHADVYEGRVKSTSAEEVAILLDAARRVVIVPGYGMAVGQAQHAVAELTDRLVADGVDVEFGIHPVAGRMPGHMNVLLAEANVDYDRMRTLEEVNPTFAETDVVVVTGANDVVNPTALEADGSPIAGMPVLQVWEADTVIVNKRSLSPGYAGIPNPLFARDNAYMLFGDARESMLAVVNEYKRTH